MQPEDFELKDAFVRDWYPNNDKFLKNKLGRLLACQFKQDEHVHLCRVMHFDRITSYQLENYFSQLTQLHMLKVVNFVTTPVGVYIDESNTIHVISRERRSLYEFLHDETEKPTDFQKLSILT